MGGDGGGVHCGGADGARRAAGASRTGMIAERFFARLTGVRGWRADLCALGLGAVSAAALPPIYVLPALLLAVPGLLALIEGTRGFGGAFRRGFLLWARAPHLWVVLDHRGDTARVGAVLVAGAACGAGVVGVAGAVHCGALCGGEVGEAGVAPGRSAGRRLGAVRPGAAICRDRVPVESVGERLGAAGGGGRHHVAAGVLDRDAWADAVDGVAGRGGDAGMAVGVRIGGSVGRLGGGWGGIGCRSRCRRRWGSTR